MDAMVSDAADESGVAQYVQTYSALARHQECTGAELGIGGPGSQFSVASNGVVTGCLGNFINGLDLVAHQFRNLPELFHPNPCGHLAEGSIVAAAYTSGVPGSVPLVIPYGKEVLSKIAVSEDVNRANVSFHWITQVPAADIHLSLTAADGTSYQPVQKGLVYATWDIPQPASRSVGPRCHQRSSWCHHPRHGLGDVLEPH